MVTFVIVVNVLISLLCLYLAWQVWNLRRTIAAVTNAVAIAERNTYVVLHGAPNAIDRGQIGVNALRERYQQLERQLQQVQQLLMLLGLLQRLLVLGLPLLRGSTLNSSPSQTPAPPPKEPSQWKRLRRSQRYRRRR